MAWTAPFTAVPNTVFTAAQFNTYVRDNLMETAPAKATSNGQVFVATDVNEIAARMVAQSNSSAEVPTESGTFSGTGPTLTLETGNRVITVVSATGRVSAGGAQGNMGVAISGESSIGATSALSLTFAGTYETSNSFVHLHTNVTPGENTFTAQYSRTPSGTAYFRQRRLLVFPVS